MSLAQFKRAIHTGMEIELVKFEERPYNQEEHKHTGEWHAVEIGARIAGVRYVSHVDTTGFYLKRSDDKSQKGSFCAFPRAAELAYDGDRTFTITDLGTKGEECSRRHYKIITK